MTETRLQIAAKGVSLVEMNDRERRMVSYLIEHGYRLGWRNNSANFFEMLAFQMGWNRPSVSKALTMLEDRGWLEAGTDSKGSRFVSLTEQFVDECEAAIKRRTVRIAFGIRGWAWLQPSEAEVDAVLDKAASMTAGGKLHQRARSVYKALYDAGTEHKLDSVTELLATLDIDIWGEHA